MEEKLISEDINKKITKRINKVNGQLKGIQRMIDEDRPCEDILVQVSAAKGVLHKVAQLLLERELNGIIAGRADLEIDQESVDRFYSSLSQFAKII